MSAQNQTEKFSPADLIVNPDGSVYHLNLRPEDVADIVLLVGDPDRTEEVASHFEEVEIRKQKREFKTITGRYKGLRLTTISSGIGADNVEIVMNELDAAVNIDLENRTIKPVRKCLKMIRIGTSGAIRADLGTDTFLASEAAVGFDSLLHFYERKTEAAGEDICRLLQAETGLPFLPYFGRADADLLQIFSDFPRGNTATCPGFYAPQDRQLRYRRTFPGFADKLRSFNGPAGFTFSNFEMETAAYYAFGQILGHKMLSLNALIANRETNVFSENPAAITKRLIATVFERLERV